MIYLTNTFNQAGVSLDIKQSIKKQPRKTSENIFPNSYVLFHKIFWSFWSLKCTLHSSRLQFLILQF